MEYVEAPVLYDRTRPAPPTTKRLPRVIFRPRQDVKRKQKLSYTQALQALYVPPQQRSEDMVQSISNCLSTWPDFISNIHSDKERHDICSEITIQRYQGNTILFKQGDSPDGWYLVFSGSCLVIINWPDDTYDSLLNEDQLFVLRFYFGEDSHFRLLAVKGPTQEFGSTALIKSKPRNATIFVNEDSQLLHVDAVYYQMSVQWYAKMQMKRRETFLEEIPDLKLLQEDRACYDRLAENLRERNFSKGDIISRENFICQGFFVLMTGCFLKTYVCDFNGIPKHSDTIKLMDGFEVNYPTSIQNVKTRTYGPMDVVADPSLKDLKGQPFYYVVIKDTTGYEIPMSELYYLVPVKIRERVLSILLKEPTDTELLHQWMENERKIIWKAYKKQCSKEARQYMKTEQKLLTGNVIGRTPTIPKPVKSPKKSRYVIRYNVVA